MFFPVFLINQTNRFCLAKSINISPNFTRPVSIDSELRLPKQQKTRFSKGNVRNVKTLIAHISRSTNRLDLRPVSIESQLSWLSIEMANAVAAGDLGFEVTFFYVTSANFGQNLDF